MRTQRCPKRTRPPHNIERKIHNPFLKPPSPRLPCGRHDAAVGGRAGMRTTIRCLAPVKAGVAGGVDLLAKPVQFVMQTVRALHVTIVGEPGHRRLCLQAAVTQPP